MENTKEQNNEKVTNVTNNTEINEREEQERTTNKKAEMIDAMRKSLCIVKMSCEAIGIERMTYYRWLENDKEFKNKIETIKREMLGDVEDRLFKAIVKEEAWAIRLFLNRRHPDYKPKQEIYIPTEKTLEDIIAENRAKVAKAQEEYDKTRSTNKSGTNSRVVENKGQEGENSAVSSEHSTEVIRKQEDEKKPNTESTAEGVK